MKKIALFASGSGSNAENIIIYFRQSATVKVQIVFTNNIQAGVIVRAQKYDVPVLHFTRAMLYDSDYIVKLLQINNIDLIVLAGFLWLIPVSMIQAFPLKIINIHPALLPKYGGPGMYGMHVHRAVKDNKEKESGISIHYVNEEYDKGTIIFQATCPVNPQDSPDDIAAKVHELEYRHFPVVIDNLLKK